MATNNSVNMGIQENADGGQVQLGVTQRILKWLGANITLTGSGSNTHTFPATSSTLLSDQPGEITALDEKTSLADDDVFVIEDSEDSDTKKAVKKSTIASELGGGGDGIIGARGLQGKNNSGTPNTQYDFSADMVVLRNHSTGAIVVRTNTGTITNNVSTSGSTANGRDQSGAFSASSWIHFYWIWNGTTLATVSSATAPPTGPTLPSGYTHWAYIGAIRFNASSQLMDTQIVGNRIAYKNGASETPIVNATNETTEQTASVSTRVPPNALTFVIDVLITNTTGGDRQVLLKFVSGKNFSAPLLKTGVGITFPCEMPNVSQQFFWNWNGSGGSSVYIVLSQYSVPNGAS